MFVQPRGRINVKFYSRNWRQPKVNNRRQPIAGMWPTFHRGGTRPGLASQASTSQMPIMSFSLRESWSWSSPPCRWPVGRLLYSSERRNIRLRQGYGGQARATHIQCWFPRHSLATAGPGQPRSSLRCSPQAPANRVSGATASGSGNSLQDCPGRINQSHQ